MNRPYKALCMTWDKMWIFAQEQGANGEKTEATL